MDFTVIRHAVLGSTSTEARRLVVEESGPLPFVVRADRQTAGRGRGEHAWWSDAGSLTLTIAIDPVAHGLRQEHEPNLALTTAVAIIDAVSPLVMLDSLGIRWPNDLEATGRKLGGILPERVETHAGARLLIGIGLNVRTNLALAPRDIERMATTLEQLHGAPMGEDALEQCFALILGSFTAVLPRLATADPALADRWRALDVLAGKRVTVQQGTRLIEGHGAGIEPSGGLRLLTAQGPVTVFGGQVMREPP